uniref:chitinase n=1 Tax=Crocus sativus TaxID=82528 RepID=B5L6N2_CROSA|nr:chitinase [Crocus sativus]
MKIAALAILILASISAPFAAQCGKEANGAICPNDLCCSFWGYCGSTEAYCSGPCQSQCGSVGRAKEGVSAVISSSQFNEMLLHRDNEFCPARGFYTYDAFVDAANSFPGFAAVGDMDNQKRDVAAFLAQSSHYTTGGWPDAPDGEFAWGFCYFLEQAFPHNHKNSPAREVPTNATLSFEKAISFWMTERPPKPSCHDVMSGMWMPTITDVSQGRLPGFGLTINIMNGREECGHGEDYRANNRIGFYKRFCDILGVSYGENLDCNNQTPFGDRGRSAWNIFKQ